MENSVVEDTATGIDPVRSIPWDGDCSHSIIALNGEVALRCAGDGDTRVQLAEALIAASRVHHEHLLAPSDYWTEGSSLVTLYRVPKQSLADVCGVDGLHEGAAVTVLAPLLSALEAAHAAGVTGLQLDLDSIWVDEAGMPLAWLHGVRVASESPTPFWRKTCAEVERDGAAMDSLIVRVLGDRADALPPIVKSAIAERHWQRAAEELIAWQQPVALSAVIEEDTPAAGARRAQFGSRKELRSARKHARLRFLPLLIDAVVTPALRVLGRWHSAMGEVRRGVWIAGGAGIVAAVSAITLVSLQGTSSSASEAHKPTSTVERNPVQEASTSTPETEVDGGIDEAAVPEEDVETILVQLLQERERCLSTGESDCLSEVVMDGTLLYSDDTMGVPQWRAPESFELLIDQHLGDAVIATVHTNEQPASMLAVNTEAGWRLREIWLI